MQNVYTKCIIIIKEGGVNLSVQKSFRLDDFANAILEELSERSGKTQTAIIEELLRGHVVFDLEHEEGIEVMRSAERRMETLKSKKTE